MALFRGIILDNVQNLFEDTASSGNAKSSKPDPDIVQVTHDKRNDSPQQTVMLGDTRCDIESAGKASGAVISLRCGWHQDASPLAARRKDGASR